MSCWTLTTVGNAISLLFVSISSGCHNKYHRCKGSNNRNFFITVLRMGSPRSRCQEILFQVKAYSVLLPATFLQCPHTAMKEREWALGLSSSSHKDTNLLTGAPLSWPHLNLITYHKGPSFKYHHVVVMLGLQHKNFWENTNIHESITLLQLVCQIT